MKILHVYKTYEKDLFGGIERTIAQFATISNSNVDFSHTVLSVSKQATLFKEDRLKRKNIFPNPQGKQGLNQLYYKEDFCLSSTSISLGLLWDFQKLAKQADIIHYHFPWPFADLMHLLHQIKKPSILTYHSDIIRQNRLLHFYKPLMKRFLNSVDKIIATSPNYLSTSSVLQKYKHKVSVIPIGINHLDYPKPTKEKLQYWQKILGNKFFLFVGVMRYYKGLHILLDAAADNAYPIVIVGAGPIENALKQQAKRLNLTKVYFLGRLPEEDKVALLTLCLAVLFPSNLRSEAFGISLLEGAMFGKPLISSEIGTGTSYINIHEETGLVIPPNDPVALRNAMQFIWENPDKNLLMGNRAAARYREFFTASKMVLEYENLYRKL